MARPRIFVSSTYYDLKHLRSSIENFIVSMGFDAILSEKGRIAYTPDIPLDESCYREVASVDMFVLIVGGRYGSEVSATKTELPKTFYDRYNSVTRGEYRAAVQRDIPMYILVERSVYAEYETYLRNKNNKSVSYAHVQSVNVFELMEDILAQPRNNPLQQFDRYEEIETWLKEQWAGLFRELLNRVQAQAQIASLQAEVAQLAELNKTLKTYLEEIISRVAPKESASLIEAETTRLMTAQRKAAVSDEVVVRHLASYGAPDGLVVTVADSATSLDSFFQTLRKVGSSHELAEELARLESLYADDFLRDLNRLRKRLGRPPIRRHEGEKMPKRSRKARSSPKKTA